MNKIIHALLLISLLTVGCSGNEKNSDTEDKEAKKLLQGVWINEESGMPSFMAKGDSIFYPDTTSLPVRFWVSKDSLFLQGKKIGRYRINTLSDKQFVICNRNEEEIRLSHGSYVQAQKDFLQDRPYALNALRIIKTDTVVYAGGIKYDCTMSLEPTSDRVIKSSYNDDGIEVDNLYLDNMVRLEISKDGRRLYSQEFRKQEFSTYVPSEFMSKSILRDFQYSHASANALFFNATIGIPDASTCYVIELKIDKEGRLSKMLK